MAAPYAISIPALTTPGSTTFPDSFRLISITNTDATNFATISFAAAVGTSLNPEAVILHGASVDFSHPAIGINVKTLYWKGDTGTVSLSVLGYLD